MAIFQGSRYSFRKPAHWRRGLMDNFAISEAGLAAPAALSFVPVNGADGECAPLPAFDPCGHLHWLRADSGELVRHHDFGNALEGTLPDAEPAKALAIGFDRFWLLARDRLHRYAAGSRQYLGVVEPPAGHVFVSIADDGGSGVWALAVARGAGMLLRYDMFGRPCGPWKKLAAISPDAAIAASRQGRWIAIVEARKDVDLSPHRKTWRVIIVTPRDPKEDHEFMVDATGKRPLVAVDASDRIHVVADGPGEPGNRPAAVGEQAASGALEKWIHTYTVRMNGPHDKAAAEKVEGKLQGADKDKQENEDKQEDKQEDKTSRSLILECIARRKIQVPRRWRLRAIAAHDHIVVAGAQGLAFVSETEPGAGTHDEIVSTFITPTLLSPDGQGGRWNSADVDAVFGEGHTLEISVAASGNAFAINEIERIFGDSSLTQAERLRALNKRIPWDDARTVVYPGTSGEPVPERLRVLLDAILETHLWMRLRLRAVAGAPPPRIKALTILYPEHSYLEFLPAIYRENEASAKELRRFLTPVEALFDEIDDEIDELPRRIDPHTAPASLPRRKEKKSLPPTWSAFLLRWLGFPAVDGLPPDVVKALLQSAPELLAGRGTQQALQDVLDILTDHHARVRDSAAMPRPWILPSPETSDLGPRLGIDTMAAGADPNVLRLGLGQLGKSRLDDGCVDPVSLLARSNGDITVTIGLDPPQRKELEPVICSFLELFVPAHCHLRLIVLPTAQWRTQIGIEDGLVIAAEGNGPGPHAARLAEAPGGRLGSTTGLGCWQLPTPAFSTPLLDHSAYLNDARLT